MQLLAASAMWLFAVTACGSGATHGTTSAEPAGTNPSSGDAATGPAEPDAAIGSVEPDASTPAEAPLSVPEAADTDTNGPPDEPLPPPLPADAPAVASCGDAGVRAVVHVPDAVLTCGDGFASCTGRLSIGVENCGPALMIVLAIEVTNATGGVTRLDFAPDTFVRRGTTLTAEPFVGREGEQRVRVLAAERDGTPFEPAQVVAHVTNPARDAARAACDACHGNWGNWGISGLEGCICRTNDAGKECRDGAECEGECVFERFEEVSPGMGRPVGRCSEVEIMFGCNPLIRDGAAADPPQTLPGHAPNICVD